MDAKKCDLCKAYGSGLELKDWVRAVVQSLADSSLLYSTELCPQCAKKLHELITWIGGVERAKELDRRAKEVGQGDS